MIAFKNAYLIDGTGAAPVPDATVIVEGRSICCAGAGISVPEDAFVIDLKGKPLIPGLSDAHAHIGGSAELDRPGCSSAFSSYLFAENREAALRWGVTALRSAGDFTPDILRFRDEVNSGKHRSPRVIACGRFIQARGGHPLSTVFSDDPAIAENACVLIDDASDVETEVEKLYDQGADWIKVVASDDNKFKYPDSTVPRLSDDQLLRISETAHKLGLPVMAHVDDIADAARAARAGVDTIEHLINIATSDHVLTDEIIRLLTDEDIWVVPTLIATKNHDGGIEGAPLAWPDLQSAMRLLIESGARIGVGCDSGIPFIPFGECVHTEMELLTEVGYTPLEAITAATGCNAKMLRAADVFGTIAPGQAADVVVLGSNPLDNIRNTRDIRLVLRDGAVVVDNLLSQ